jgi:hypothetical protein
MQNWDGLRWLVCAVGAIAVYFSAALWLKHSYAGIPKPAGMVFRLDRPIFNLQDSDVAFVVKAPSLDHLSDTMKFPERSPFALYENTTALGPAHAEHTEIRQYGHGRFSHWNGSGFIFSSSDGTDPKSNGRTYWAVIPPPAE